MSWENYKIEQKSNNELMVSDLFVEDGFLDRLQFTESIVNFQMNFGYLLVATTKQIYVYSVSNFNTPQTFPLRGSISMMLQSDSCVLRHDNFEAKI